MQSKAGRVGLLVALAAAAVVLFIVLSGDDDSGSGSGDETTATATDTGGTVPEPPVQAIVIKDGKPAAGVTKIEVSKGDSVRFIVQSDVAEEVHVHGYDIAKNVEAGGSVEFDFPATIDGVFEIELEGSATQIAELTVQPG
jgi:hypothetical protein